MSAVAQTPEVAGPAARTWWDVAEACLAVAAFAVLCVLVLRTSPYLPEPDDYAWRWLGSSGGASAVGLYCSSGAALLFAWRDYMPTFTEASLIAAGTGALLWTELAAEASVRRRTWAGLAGFVALEAATFSRYTNIAVLGCAVIAVLVAWRRRAAR